MKKKLALYGFPTEARTYNGDVICIGDTIQIIGTTPPVKFRVVWENNAIRKSFSIQDATQDKPILESGRISEQMNYEIVEKNSSTQWDNLK